MTDEELDRVEEAIQDRQKYVERKTSKLKTDLMMKKTAKIWKHIFKKNKNKKILLWNNKVKGGFLCTILEQI